MTFFIGAIGAISVQLILVLGIVIGWKLHKHDQMRMRSAAEDNMTEAELRREIRRQKALEEIESYTAEQAYGMRMPLNDDEQEVDA